MPEPDDQNSISMAGLPPARFGHDILPITEEPPEAGSSAFEAFACQTGHEICNVTSGMTLALSIIVKKTARATFSTEGEAREVADLIRDVRTAMESLTDMVQALRSFGRGGGGDTQTFDPLPALQVAIRLIEGRIEGRAVIRRAFSETPHVHGRKHEFTSVFLNLLLNAANAIDDRPGPSMAITVRAGTDGLSRAAFEVEDTGVGIAPEIAPRVFEPYFSGRPKRGGTGLGLYVSQNIVRAMGGEIRFDSTVGVGSRFHVLLPSAPPGSR